MYSPYQHCEQIAFAQRHAAAGLSSHTKLNPVLRSASQNRSPRGRKNSRRAMYANRQRKFESAGKKTGPTPFVFSPFDARRQNLSNPNSSSSSPFPLPVPQPRRFAPAEFFLPEICFKTQRTLIPNDFQSATNRNGPQRSAITRKPAAICLNQTPHTATNCNPSQPASYAAKKD
jgi:hypothetical protein